MQKITQFFVAMLTAMVALLFSASAYANGLVNDPFVQQHIDKSTFEPGGQNHLFGAARGTVTDRSGDIYLIPTNSIQAGGVSIEQAIIAGKYDYTARFSGHGHEAHAPFASSHSRERTAEQGVVGMDFTSLSMQWVGTEVHPADAYDGKQGGGYPAPTGARDEYSYAVGGNAISARVNFDDSRSPQDRFKDRGNALEQAKDGLTQAFKEGTTHNPELSAAGNAAEAVSAAAKGLGAVTGVPLEAAGLSDVMDAAAVARDIAALEAMRALSHEDRLSAAQALQSAQRLKDEYQAWRAENPNAAAVTDTAFNVANATLRGGDRVDAKPRNRPPPPDPRADGQSHTIIERFGREGQYTTYYEDGTWKQYRGSGQDHGNIPRPNVKETTTHTHNGQTFTGKPTVRKPREDEYPK
ncbi:MAG: MafB family polymorphic toxin [Moraxella sp.]|nr:MafB family polymorphic toxin [Moraxella sp.]